jgi:hypothetical protein
MKSNHRKHLVSGFWITAIVVLTYLLSIGPAYRLMRTGSIPQNKFLFLYAPINKCCDHSIFLERILDNYYLELWYSDTRNQKLWLKQLGDSQKTTLQGDTSTNSVPPKQK